MAEQMNLDASTSSGTSTSSLIQTLKRTLNNSNEETPNAKRPNEREGEAPPPEDTDIIRIEVSKVTQRFSELRLVKLVVARSLMT